MAISSRTPEGDPNCCPICGSRVRIDPSTTPTRDAPCPHCGSRLLFAADSEEITALHTSLGFGRRHRLVSFLSAGRKKFGTIPGELIRPLLQAERKLIASKRVRDAADIKLILETVGSWSELVSQLERIAELPQFSKFVGTRMFLRRQLQRLLPRKRHKSIRNAG